MKKLLLFQLLFFSFLLNLQSQLLVNQVWIASSGEPDQFTIPNSQWDNIDYNSSTLTESGDLIVVGNTKQSTGNTDILVTKYGINGQVLWEQTYAGSAGSYDYALAVTNDNNGNILVAGVITNNNATTDVIILKYATGGNLLFSTLLGDGNNQFDIPTAITSDNQGNIFVIGSNMSTSTDSNWTIFKLNNNGILQWSNSYNYSAFHEIPSSIKLAGNDISVIGFSGSSPSEWDFANVIFSDLNGNILTEERKQIADLSLVDVVSIKSDNADNIYIGGTTKGIITGNQDIQVVKINSDFDVEWIRTIDEEGLDDVAKVLDIDNAGNIIIAGNSSNINNESYITFSKFDSDGNTLFHKGYSGPASVQNAKVETMKISSNNNVLITGFVEQNNYKDFVTIILDSNGNINSEKFYTTNENTNDIANSIEILNDGEFFIIGKSEGDESKYTTIKYEITQRPNEIIEIDGKPHHKSHEFLVNFFPEYVDTNFVNNGEKRYGSITDILNSNGISKLNKNLDLENVRFAKIFPRLTTSHTTSISRLGESVPMPKFWSGFIVILPQNQSLINNINLFQDMTSLVDYVDYNHIYQQTSIPNDLYFGSDNQQSLYATNNSLYQNAHINIEPAWEYETGQNYTKVGIYDSPVIWSHEDLGDGTFANSQVKGGHNYVTGTQYGAIGWGDEASHGTSVAGIIGALRNNEKGIAGIAGGGIDGQGNVNPGVQLYSQAIFNTAGGVLNGTSGDVFYNAIVEGVMSVSNPPNGNTGLGLHITNQSHGIFPNGLNGGAILSLRAAMRFSFENHVLTVASKGNGGNDNDFFPADVRNEYVLSVGASGFDGEYKNQFNGDLYLNSGIDCNNWSSNYGGEIDVIAPGVTEIVTSLINAFPYPDPNDPDCGYPTPLSTGNTTNYQAFRGTSAAAPHVTGVAALMHSLHNTAKGQYNNLAPEDYEFLLKEYADDISSSIYPVGPDEYNGHGRVNAGAVLEKLEYPFWSVWHNFAPAPEDIDVETTFSSDSNFELTEYKITHTYNYTFSPSTQIKDAWGRNSSGMGIQAPFVSGTIKPIEATFSFNYTPDDNEISVTAITYLYKRKSLFSGNTTWYPTNYGVDEVADARTRFSLHLYDPNGITSVKNITETTNIKIFPNPTNGFFTLQHNQKGNNVSLLNIFDTTGKMVLSNKVLLLENQSLEIDLQKFPNGIYFCQLVTELSIFTSKVIKQ